MNKIRSVFILYVFSALLSMGMPTLAIAEQGLRNIGDLPGGAVNAQASATTNSGSAVVGSSNTTTGWRAFKWTPSGGITDLGDLPGGTNISYGQDVSADGSIIVGSSNTTTGWRAFRWTQGTGMVDLGDLPGGLDYSYASAVTTDGSMVVGGSHSGGYEAATWTQAGGMVGYGDLPGGASNSGFYATSSDGRYLVGYGTNASGDEAVRWTQSTGMVALGDLAGGGHYSYAYGVSDDGSVVVGESESAAGWETIRWTEATGLIGLGDLPGGVVSSYANAISGDGLVIVGSGTTAAGREAFRWTQETGMIRVEDWLSANGHALTGWTRLSAAFGVNYNGSVVVGNGITAAGTEAYIATVGGLITPTNAAQSLASVQSVSQTGNRSTNLIMHGAHHRSLYDQGYEDNHGNCVWANADASKYNRYDAHVELAEVGACRDVVPDQVRVGVGVGTSQSREELVLYGETETKGQYVVAEANWKVPNMPVIASVTGMAGTWDANVKRGYMNAGNVDTSRGETDMTAQTLRFRLEARNVANIEGISISPRVEYAATRTHMDGYTETTGGFPARFDEQTSYSHQARLGVTATRPLSEKTTASLTAEAVHRFDSDTAKSSGEVLGLFSFNQPGQNITQTWGRVGLDVDHKLTPASAVSFSVHGASRGEDPDVSASISYKRSFAIPE